MAAGGRALAGLALLAGLAGCPQQGPRAGTGPRRIVSLSPALTETLFALGAGDEVVGVSDYCDFPPEARRRPRVGTTLSPSYEAVARLRPTLIVGEQVQHSPGDGLAAIAPTVSLPWLTLDDVVASTRELGRLAGRGAPAEALADRLRSTLSRPAPPNGPRVLLAIDGEPGPLTSVWFVKRGSLHEAALEAAGARNAVAEDVSGPPTLSLEKVIALDPQVVIVLVAAGPLEAAEQERYLAAWRALSGMGAVKRGAVRIISGTGVQSTGPRILDLVEQLRAAIRDAAGGP